MPIEVREELDKHPPSVGRPPQPRKKSPRRRSKRSPGSMGADAPHHLVLVDRVLAAAAAANSKHWGVVFALISVAVLAFLFAPSEHSPVYGLDHEFPIESDEFSEHDRRRDRHPVFGG